MNNTNIPQNHSVKNTFIKFEIDRYNVLTPLSNYNAFLSTFEYEMVSRTLTLYIDFENYREFYDLSIHPETSWQRIYSINKPQFFIIQAKIKPGIYSIIFKELKEEVIR